MRIIFLLSVVLFACTDHVEQQPLTGSWNIAFKAFGENRQGVLFLRNNNTGHFIMDPDSSSILLPDADQFDLQWQKRHDELIITRADNNFVLKYHVVSSTQSSVHLTYTDEIQIYLTR